MTSLGTLLVALAALAVGFTLGWLVREQRPASSRSNRPGKPALAPSEWVEQVQPLESLQSAFQDRQGSEAIAASVLASLKAMVPAEEFHLHLLDTHRQTLRNFHRKASEAPEPVGEGMESSIPGADTPVGWMLAHREPIVLLNAQQDELPAGANPDLFPETSFIGVPLTLEDEIFGVLTATHRLPGSFNQLHYSLLRFAGAQAAAALHLEALRRDNEAERERIRSLHATQTEELNRRRSLIDTLLEMTNELNRTVDLDRVYRRASALITEAVQADRGFLLVREGPSTEALKIGAAVARNGSVSRSATIEEIPAPIRELAQEVTRTREAAWIADLADTSARGSAYPGGLDRSALAVPLLMGEDTLGVLVCSSCERSAFAEDHIRLAGAAAQQLANAMYNAELYNLIRDQAANLGSMLREKQIETGTSHAVLESIADGVIATDAEDRVVVFNRSAERILGLNSSSVVGRPVFEITGAYGGAAQRLRDAISDWRERPAEHGNAQEYLEERITLEDNRVVSLHLAQVTIRDEFFGTVSIFRDITREVEVDRLKSEFVATVSHELRTPMTSIKGYVEMILMGAVGDLNTDQRRFLQVIRSNIERLGDLVNDLLDISRIESGRVSLELIDFDLRGLLREVRDTFERRTRLEDKPMQIELEVPDDLPRVRADPARIRQVLTNLAANSFNYTPSGGRIVISAWDTDGEVVIRILDNGMGIPPQEHAKVFERFYRGQGALELSISGTGLGLPIVKELVEMHQGRIWLESAGVPGEGSEFTFSLPLASRQLEPA